MKSFKLHHKISATVIALFFAFQSMSEINSHAYSTGVINIHADYSCLNNAPIHIDYYCSYYNCNWNN